VSFIFDTNGMVFIAQIGGLVWSRQQYG